MTWCPCPAYLFTSVPPITHFIRGADGPVLATPWTLSTVCSVSVLPWYFVLTVSSRWASHQSRASIPASVMSMLLSWRWLPFQGTGGGAGPGGWKASQLPYSCHGNHCLSLGNMNVSHSVAHCTCQTWTAEHAGTHLGTTPLGGRRKHRKEEMSLSSSTLP